LKTSRFILCIAVAALAVLACYDRSAQPPVATVETKGTASERIDKGVLILPSVTEGALADAREIHSFRFELTSESVLHARVEQIGIDLSVALVAGDGLRLREIDTPTGRNGPEDLWFLTSPGPYRIEISPLEGSGSYRLFVEARLVSPENRRPAEAQSAELEGQQYLRRWELDFAVDALAKARNLWQESGLPRQAALTLVQLAKSEVLEGRRELGFEHYEEALARFETLSEQRQEVRVLNDLGLALLDSGRLEEAEAKWRRALEIARQVGHRGGEAAALNNLALIFFWRGEPDEALARDEQALAIWRQLGRDSEVAQTLQNTASAYLLIDQWDEALADLQEAQRISRASNDRRRLFEILLTIGWLHHLRGDPRTALRFYGWAAGFVEDANEISSATLLDRMGTAYTELGDWPQAEGAYAKASAALGTRGHLFARAQILTNLCRLRVLSERMDAAEESCRQALADLQEAGDADGQATVLYWSARLSRSRGNLHLARELIEKAIALLEGLRAGLRSPAHRRSYLAGWFELYEFRLDLLLELRDRELGSDWDAEILAAIEKTRARSLLDLLADAHVELRQRTGGQFLDAERRLDARLSESRQLRRRLEEEGADPETLSRAISRQQALEAESTRILGKLRSTSPAYEGIAWPRTLYLGEIQALLDDGTLLLVYSLGERRSVLCLVGPSTLSLYELPPRSQIEPLARAWYDLLSDPGKQWANEQRSVVASSLSHILLEPAADQLTRRRLVVLGDGALRYLPFSALPNPAASDASRLLLDDHEIVYLPSASTLAILRDNFGRRPPSPGLLAVVADPVFDSTDERLAPRPGEKPTGQSPFPRLRFAQEEAAGILGAAPPGSRVLQLEGFEANRENVLSGALRNYRIVHFATHAIVEARGTSSSRIVLSQVDAEGHRNADLLQLQDVYNLDLPAELVVLSACQTALGEDVRGEGLVGLARGFMYAGSPRVLVSLWNVEDEATAVLMKDFYRGLLREGREPAAALRAAQLAMRRERRWQPYHWAGFVLQGEWRGFDISVEQSLEQKYHSGCP